MYMYSQYVKLASPLPSHQSLGGGEIRFSVKREADFWGRHLSPTPSEGGLQPIVCFQPTRSDGEGFVSGSVAK